MLHRPAPSDCLAVLRSGPPEQPPHSSLMRTNRPPWVPNGTWHQHRQVKESFERTRQIGRHALHVTNPPDTPVEPWSFVRAAMIGVKLTAAPSLNWLPSGKKSSTCLCIASLRSHSTANRRSRARFAGGVLVPVCAAQALGQADLASISEGTCTSLLESVRRLAALACTNESVFQTEHELRIFLAAPGKPHPIG